MHVLVMSVGLAAVFVSQHVESSSSSLEGMNKEVDVEIGMFLSWPCSL